MTKPVRLQLSRRKGFNLQALSQQTNGLPAVNVARPSKWGNPFIPGRDSKVIPGRKVEDKRHAASLFLGFAPQMPKVVEAAQAELRGKNVACWCGLCDMHKITGKPLGSNCPYCDRCHADVLLELANR